MSHNPKSQDTGFHPGPLSAQGYSQSASDECCPLYFLFCFSREQDQQSLATSEVSIKNNNINSILVGTTNNTIKVIL